MDIKAAFEAIARALEKATDGGAQDELDTLRGEIDKINTAEATLEAQVAEFHPGVSQADFDALTARVADLENGVEGLGAGLGDTTGAGGGSDTTGGGAGSDTTQGGSGADTTGGAAGDDTAAGTGDTLTAGGGADTTSGGAGADTLTGGADTIT